MEIESVQDLILPHQAPHILILLKAIKEHGIAIDMSDTGSGKSYVVISICKILGLRPFFIGLKSGINNLYEISRDFGVEPIGNINYESLKNGKYYRNLDDFLNNEKSPCPYIKINRVNRVNAITGDIMYNKNSTPKVVIESIDWMFPENTLIVFDEAHKAKNGKTSTKESDNSKLVVSVKKYISREKNILCMLLSATITDRIESFDVVTYMLGFYRPYTKINFGQFVRRLGSNPLKKINQKIFPDYGARMSIRNIKMSTGNSIFRNNDIQAVIYPVSEKIAVEIERLHEKISKILGEIRSTGGSMGFGKIIKCWRKIEILKIPTAADLVEKYVKEGNAVVLFVNFKQTKDIIYEDLLSRGMDKIDFIEGRQTTEERLRAIDEFQNNNIDILICQTAAGSNTISLHDLNGKPRVSIIFPTWAAINMKQIFGRIYRANSRSDAVQRILYCKYHKDSVEKVAEGADTLSVEERICNIINEKLQNIEIINDGDVLGHTKI